MNIAEIIEGIARRQPARTAIVDTGRELSYGELASLVRRTAALLRRAGVAAGTRIGLCLGDDADYLVALLGVAALGAVGVPMDWRSTGKEREAAVRTFGLSFVIGVPDGIGEARAVPLDEAWRRAVAVADPIDGFVAGDGMPWLVCLSSGTTGAPKGAMLTHEQQFARYVARREGVGWGEAERHLSATALVFVAARDFLPRSSAERQHGHPVPHAVRAGRAGGRARAASRDDDADGPDDPAPSPGDVLQPRGAFARSRASARHRRGPALVRHCRGRLTPYKIPREVFLVEEMPRTASGKVQKGLLAARLPRR